MNTIQSLRKSGVKVRVLYERFVKVPTAFPEYQHVSLQPLYSIRLNKTQKYMLARGGKTTIQATTIDGRDFEGVAVCSAKDSFNRHTALSKAIGRLVSNITNNVTSV